MIVEDFITHRVGGFDDRIYSSFPVYCDETSCGYPLEMSETLTQLHCSNPRCPSKLTQRLVAIANSLGVKDLGEARASKFIAKLSGFGMYNPLYIFAFDPEEDGELGDGISLDVTRRIISQFKERSSFTVAEYVRMANLPFIQTSAFTIFGDYDDLYKAYEDIEIGGVEFIRNKLSISKGADGDEDVSLRALRVFDSLMTFKQDLLECVDCVNIISTHKEGSLNFTAVCSDQVGEPFRTKAEFYAEVNNRFPDRVHVEFLGAVTKKIDFLIWAGADGSPAKFTNKVKKVTAYNDKYAEAVSSGTVKEGDHHIQVMTANQFLEYLEGVV